MATQNSKNRTGKKRDSIHPKTQFSVGGPSRLFDTTARLSVDRSQRTSVGVPTAGRLIFSGRSAGLKKLRRPIRGPQLLPSRPAQNAFQICNVRAFGAAIHKRHAFCPTRRIPTGGCCRSGGKEIHDLTNRR